MVAQMRARVRPRAHPCAQRCAQTCQAASLHLDALLLHAGPWPRHGPQTLLPPRRILQRHPPHGRGPAGCTPLRIYIISPNAVFCYPARGPPYPGGGPAGKGGRLSCRLVIGVERHPRWPTRAPRGREIPARGGEKCSFCLLGRGGSPPRPKNTILYKSNK